jgi:hypothetical protein
MVDLVAFDERAKTGENVKTNENKPEPGIRPRLEKIDLRYSIESRGSPVVIRRS